MSDHRGAVSAMRLPEGCVILDAPAAALVGELLKVALHHRPHLWVARSADDRDRVRRLRDLSAACPTSASASDNGSAEAVEDATSRIIGGGDRTSVKEAAEVLQLTTRRVTELLTLGVLTGEQDAPGRPWRVDLASVHRHQTSRRQAA